jgi:hypothetical protein
MMVAGLLHSVRNHIEALLRADPGLTLAELLASAERVSALSLEIHAVDGPLSTGAFRDTEDVGVRQELSRYAASLQRLSQYIGELEDRLVVMRSELVRNNQHLIAVNRWRTESRELS